MGFGMGLLKKKPPAIPKEPQCSRVLLLAGMDRAYMEFSADSDRGTFFQAYSDLENISRSARAMGRRRQGLHRFYANRRIRAKTAIESFQRESIAAH